MKMLTAVGCAVSREATEQARQSTGCGFRRWFGLAAGLLAIWFFVYGFAPWLQRHSEAVRTLAAYIEASGLNAGAFYYTGVEEVGEADRAIRNTMRFTPAGPPPSAGR